MTSRYLMLILCAAWLAAQPAMSQGGLLITPTRVVFEGRSRTGTLTLVNRSSETTSYRLFFSEKLMNGQGVLMDLGPGQQGRFSSPMVRFSPRHVRLEPGQTQKVRLQWRPPTQLEPSEYRSHLVFQVSPETGGYSLAESRGEDGSIGIHLTPLIGASIPIIVRRGDLSANIRVADARLEPRGETRLPCISIEFQREGDRSVYGDVQVQWIKGTEQPKDIGFVKGMAIYPELERRHLEVPLTWQEGFSKEGGHLNIRYISREQDEKLLAEFNLKVL